jgi:hypothetical protein
MNKNQSNVLPKIAIALVACSSAGTSCLALAQGLPPMIPGQAQPMGPEMPANASPESILDAKLAMHKPEPLPSELQNPTLAQGVDQAFNNDDLKEIYKGQGFENCQTSSAGPSPFAKNFSNFGADCYKSLSDRYYVSSDVTLRQNGNAFLRPAYGWNGAKLRNITSPAGTRFASRTATSAAGSNRILKSLVLGKFEFGFSFGSAWANLTKPAVASRPRYVLKVARSATSPTRPTLVAALGNTGYEYAQKDDLQDFTVGERSIVEEWDVLPPLADAEPEPMGMGGRVARYIGVSSSPFSSFNLRFERRSNADGEQLLARVAETNDIVFAESSNIIGKTVVTYGYRVPYHRHSVTVAYATTTPSATTTYAYRLNEENRMWAAYNANTKAYEAGIKRQN